MIGGRDIASEIVLRWILLDLSDDKSTLVQVMAWCRQATSHYLSQCWPRSMSPYGIIRPQWVKLGRMTAQIKFPPPPQPLLPNSVLSCLSGHSDPIILIPCDVTLWHSGVPWMPNWLNPLRAKFFRENINIYFMSFLHINKTQVVEIPPWVRQGPAYSI